MGVEFTFDAGGNTNANLCYDWDLDADGIFELQNRSSVVQKVYQTPLSGYIQVRVTDSSGYSSTMSAQLKVTGSTSTPATITNLQVTALSDTEYRLDFETNAEKVLVAIGDLPVGQLASNQHSITIGDITTRTTVRLIPYRSTTGRGEAVTAEIGPEPATTPSESSNGATIAKPNPATPIKKPASRPAVFIPKVPNTGIEP